MMDTNDRVSKIPASVADKLNHYVYAYVDPRTGRIFYVGEGKGQRVIAHLSANAEAPLAKEIRELRAEGVAPRIDLLTTHLNKEVAEIVEAAIIDTLGLKNLANKVRGKGSKDFGRIPFSEAIKIYGAKPVKIVDPVLLIKINQLYRPDMSPEELYEATRGVWKLGARRDNAKFALAVSSGVVAEVYAIESWHKASTTPYKTRPFEDVNAPGRYEFVGKVAPEPQRSRYRWHDVTREFPEKSQNPLKYVNA